MTNKTPYIKRQELILASRLPPTQKLVLLILHFRYGDNGCSWASQTSIAQDTGLSRPGANRILKKLKEQGILSVDEEGKKQSLIYSIDEVALKQFGFTPAQTTVCDELVDYLCS